MSISFLKISLLIEQAETIIEERATLLRLKSTPSTSETTNLVNILNSIISQFNLIHDNLLSLINNRKINVNVNKSYQTKLSSFIDAYNLLLDSLTNDSMINVHDYEYEKRVIPQTPMIKTVRFKDNLIDPPHSYTDNLSKSYSDNPTDLIELNTLPTNLQDEYNQGADANVITGFNDNENIERSSNLQIFESNNDALSSQEAHLQNLHSSVSVQHHLSLAISDEVDEHNAILDDLERQVDRSGGNLRTATGRVEFVRKYVGGEGSWITILLLFFILIFLLVALG